MSSANNQIIDELCLGFDLNQSTKESANEKYETISKHISFNFTSKQTKNILSAVCLYLTLSEDKKPLTITQICSKIDININDFGRVYNQVTKEFSHLKTESVSIENLVEVILKEAVFEDEEREAIIQRVIQLIRVVRQCWLIEGIIDLNVNYLIKCNSGRSPVHIIMGAAYLGWKSLKPSIRKKVKLTEFCRIVSIEYKHTTSKRVNEIFNALKKLGQKIPGKEKFQFTPQNIAIFIHDILDYSNSLLFDLSLDVSKQFRAVANNTEDSASKWINTFKKIDRNQNLSNFTEIDSKGELKEEQISDSEIDCYIRSKPEVKKIKKLKKFVESEEQEREERQEREKRRDKKRLEKYIEIEGIDF